MEAGDIVLLTSVGYCPSGEVFNVPSDSLAAECAAKLKAAKIIYMTDGEQMVDTRTGKHIQSLRLVQAVSLLDLYGIKTNVYNQVEANPRNCVVDDFRTRKESIFTVNKVLSSLADRYQPNPASVPANLLLDDCCEDSAVSGYVRLLARYLFIHQKFFTNYIYSLIFQFLQKIPDT